MSNKIVPVYTKIRYEGNKRIEDGDVMLYDVFVNGRWVGSRRLAKDAEAMLLQHNPPMVDAGPVVG